MVPPPNSEGAVWTQLELWILPSNVPIRTVNTKNKQISNMFELTPETEAWRGPRIHLNWFSP